VLLRNPSLISASELHHRDFALKLLFSLPLELRFSPFRLHLLKPKMKSSSQLSALFSVAVTVLAAPVPDVSSTLQNILSNTHNSDLYTYPTDLTRGIIPVRKLLTIPEDISNLQTRIESPSFAQ
jgi:hypothetical protein